MLTGVIFDCDGVLIDSEPLAEEAWALVLSAHGATITTGDVSAVAGTSSTDTYNYFARSTNLPPYSEVASAVDAYLLPALADRLEPFADAVATVRALAAEGVPMAVASSSNRRELDMKLAKFDLARHFDYVIAGDEVAFGKPAPDLYVGAASGLGINPRSCLAVEDSIHGAKAAHAAGMRVVLIDRGGMIPADWSTVSSIDPELIKTWLDPV